MTPSFPTRRPSDLLVVGLHALARDHDADAADGQQRRPADRGLAAPYAGASAGEAPVSQPRDTERARKGPDTGRSRPAARSEEHTSELQSLMRTSYAVFCLKKKKKIKKTEAN